MRTFLLLQISQLNHVSQNPCWCSCEWRRNIALIVKTAATYLICVKKIHFSLYNRCLRFYNSLLHVKILSNYFLQMTSLSHPGSDFHHRPQKGHAATAAYKIMLKMTTFSLAVHHLTSSVHLSYLPSALLLFSPFPFHSPALFSSTSLTTLYITAPSLHLCLHLPSESTDI